LGRGYYSFREAGLLSLKDFYESHAASKAPLEAWCHEAKAAAW
jgi:hypothetical protein